MTQPFDLAADAQRALREAENFCWRANVAIVSAEHLLAGCLAQPGLAASAHYDRHTLERALETLHPPGMTELTSNVLFGSAAREALSMAVREAREAGASSLSASVLAAYVIASGEVHPMFFTALGVDAAELGHNLTG